MKPFIFLFLVMSVASYADNEHSGEEQGQQSGHEEVSPNQLNKLNDLVSTCLAGRPIGGSIPTGGGSTPSVTEEPPGTTPTGTGSTPADPPIPAELNGGNAGNGAVLYSSRCLSCHPGAAGAPDLSKEPRGIKMSDVATGHMPKNGTLTQTEKADLIAYFKTLPQ
jgi:mono/diheme cytochrome c family protein